MFGNIAVEKICKQMTFLCYNIQVVYEYHRIEYPEIFSMLLMLSILHLLSFCWCSRGETVDCAGIRLSSRVQKSLMYHRISAGYQIFACTTREYGCVFLPDLIGYWNGV